MAFHNMVDIKPDFLYIRVLLSVYTKEIFIMSKLLSLKIRDDIFLEVEKIIKRKKIPRNAYINQALMFYNNFNKRTNLKKQLQYESNVVKNNSLEILEGFEKLEDEFIE